MYQKQNITNQEIINFLQDTQKIESMRDSSDFKRSNDVWNSEHLNSSKSIGSLMQQIKYTHPQTQVEWYNYYLNPNKNNRIEIRGRDINEINDIAEKLYDAMEQNNIPISSEKAFQFVCIRAMYETYLGMERENNTERELQRILGNDYKIIDTDRHDDIWRCADRIICDKEGNKLYGIQIKSDVFQRDIQFGNKEYVDRENKEGFERFFKKYGIEAGYCFAEKDGYITNLNELIDKVELQEAINIYKNKDTRDLLEGWMRDDERINISEDLSRCTNEKEEQEAFKKHRDIFIDCLWHHQNNHTMER